MTFWDMGCGSGILSVAALLLGAKSAVGVDIDPLAVKTAVENAETNGVAGRFTGICGNLAEKVTGKFQVVAANIVADIVIPLKQRRPPASSPRTSTYIVSGIIGHPGAGRTGTAIQDTFQVIERREEKGWGSYGVEAEIKTRKRKERGEASLFLFCRFIL